MILLCLLACTPSSEPAPVGLGLEVSAPTSPPVVVDEVDVAPSPVETNHGLLNPQAFTKRLFEAGFQGELVSTSWPKRAPKPTTMPKLVSGTFRQGHRRTSGVRNEVNLTCTSTNHQQALKVLADWMYSTKGLKHPSRVILFEHGGCVVSIRALALYPVWDEVCELGGFTPPP